MTANANQKLCVLSRHNHESLSSGAATEQEQAQVPYRATDGAGRRAAQLPAAAGRLLGCAGRRCGGCCPTILRRLQLRLRLLAHGGAGGADGGISRLRGAGARRLQANGPGEHLGPLAGG